MGLNKFEKKSPPSSSFLCSSTPSLFLFGFNQSNIPSDVGDRDREVGFVAMLLDPPVDDGGEVTIHDDTPRGNDDDDDNHVEADANATATTTALARMVVLFRNMMCNNKFGIGIQ